MNLDWHDSCKREGDDPFAHGESNEIQLNEDKPSAFESNDFFQNKHLST